MKGLQALTGEKRRGVKSLNVSASARKLFSQSIYESSKGFSDPNLETTGEARKRSERQRHKAEQSSPLHS
jgi:hypothetical protein